MRLAVFATNILNYCIDLNDTNDAEWQLLGLDMEVIGSPCMFKVMDGSCKDHGKDLQVT